LHVPVAVADSAVAPHSPLNQQAASESHVTGAALRQATYAAFAAQAFVQSAPK
jgi:hypothetical protein